MFVFFFFSKKKPMYVLQPFFILYQLKLQCRDLHQKVHFSAKQIWSNACYIWNELTTFAFIFASAAYGNISFILYDSIQTQKWKSTDWISSHIVLHMYQKQALSYWWNVSPTRNKECWHWQVLHWAQINVFANSIEIFFPPTKKLQWLQLEKVTKWNWQY